jgi:hypothetical protein
MSSDHLEPSGTRPERHERCFYCGAPVGWPLREPADAAFVPRTSVFVGVVACHEHQDAGIEFAQALVSNLMCIVSIRHADGATLQDADDAELRDDCLALEAELDTLDMTPEERLLFRAVGSGSGRLWPDERRRVSDVLDRLFPPQCLDGEDIVEDIVEDGGDEYDSGESDDAN